MLHPLRPLLARLAPMGAAALLGTAGPLWPTSAWSGTPPSGAPTSAASAEGDSEAAAGDESDAAAQFKEALALYGAKDYAAALPIFERVVEQSGSPNARLYVARCLKEIGRIAEAYDEMDRTVRDAGELTKTEPKYEATRNAAAVALAIMDKLVGKVVVALQDTPAGMQITLDDRPISPDRIGVPLPVEAGKVSVRITAPGKRDWEQTTDIAAGQSRVITVILEDEKPTGPVGPTPAEPEGGEVRTVGWFALGVGAASLIAFGITGGMALSDFNTLEDECGGVRCTDPSYADTVDRGTTLRTVANVTLAVGATAAAVGIFMVILGGPSEPGEDDAPAVSLVPTGDGAFFGLGGRF